MLHVWQVSAMIPDSTVITDGSIVNIDVTAYIGRWGARDTNARFRRRCRRRTPVAR